MSTFYSPTGNAEVWEQKPDGYLTVEEWQATLPPPPPPTLAEARNAKLADIATVYDTVLAYIVSPDGSGAVAAALAVADFAADDPEGLTYVHTMLAARRTELEAAVNAAETAEAVAAVAVTFPV